MCLLPILFLLVTTLVKPLALPSSTALPLSAALLALIRLAYLSSPPLLVLAHCVVGSLEGLVPLAVIFGAVLLFETMAATGCLTFMMANVRCLSAGSHIAEVFLIGWAFAYTISGEQQQQQWTCGVGWHAACSLPLIVACIVTVCDTPTHPCTATGAPQVLGASLPQWHLPPRCWCHWAMTPS